MRSWPTYPGYQFLECELSERALVIWPSGHVYWSDAYSRIKRTFTFRHSKFLTLFFEMFGTGFKHFEGELSGRVLSIGIREQIPFGSQSLYFVPERVLVIWPSGHLYVSHAPNVHNLYVKRLRER